METIDRSRRLSKDELQSQLADFEGRTPPTFSEEVVAQIVVEKQVQAQEKARAAASRLPGLSRRAKALAKRSNSPA